MPPEIEKSMIENNKTLSTKEIMFKLLKKIFSSKVINTKNHKRYKTANTHYNKVTAVRDGKIVVYLFTDNDLITAETRAINNPEDL